jgi:hypothetical protein
MSKVKGYIGKLYSKNVPLTRFLLFYPLPNSRDSSFVSVLFNGDFLHQYREQFGEEGSKELKEIISLLDSDPEYSKMNEEQISQSINMYHTYFTRSPRLPLLF